MADLSLSSYCRAQISISSLKREAADKSKDAKAFVREVRDPIASEMERLRVGCIKVGEKYLHLRKRKAKQPVHPSADLLCRLVWENGSNAERVGERLERELAPEPTGHKLLLEVSEKEGEGAQDVPPFLVAAATEYVRMAGESKSTVDDTAMKEAKEEAAEYEEGAISFLRGGESRVRVVEVGGKKAIAFYFKRVKKKPLGTKAASKIAMRVCEGKHSSQTSLLLAIREEIQKFEKSGETEEEGVKVVELK